MRDQEEVLCCPECENTYMTQVKVARYTRQRVPVHQAFHTDYNEIYFLQCIKCQTIVPHDAEYPIGTKAQYVYPKVLKELFGEEESKSRVPKTKAVEQRVERPFGANILR